MAQLNDLIVTGSSRFLNKIQGTAVAADEATTAARLNNTAAIGNASSPVYFNASGVPVAINGAAITVNNATNASKTGGVAFGSLATVSTITSSMLPTHTHTTANITSFSNAVKATKVNNASTADYASKAGFEIVITWDLRSGNTISADKTYTQLKTYLDTTGNSITDIKAKLLLYQASNYVEHDNSTDIVFITPANEFLFTFGFRAFKLNSSNVWSYEYDSAYALHSELADYMPASVSYTSDLDIGASGISYTNYAPGTTNAVRCPVGIDEHGFYYHTAAATANRRMITFVSGDDTGHGILITGGGYTVIGGGESANYCSTGTYATFKGFTPATEEMVVASDNNVYLVAGCQNAATASHFEYKFRNDGIAELGEIIDFHSSAHNAATAVDYEVRLRAYVPQAITSASWTQALANRAHFPMRIQTHNYNGNNQADTVVANGPRGLRDTFNTYVTTVSISYSTTTSYGGAVAITFPTTMYQAPLFVHIYHLSGAERITLGNCTVAPNNNSWKKGMTNASWSYTVSGGSSTAAATYGVLMVWGTTAASSGVIS